MSHPLHGTIPAGKCADCSHWARPDEVTACAQCDCPHHRAEGPYGGHDPQSPPGAEAALQSYSDALENARLELARLRNLEVDAKAIRDTAKRRALLSKECPKATGPGRTMTVAERDAWVEDQIADDDLAYEIAKAARQAAGDHLHTLGKQGSLAQSLSRSVGQSYLGQREPGW